METLKKMFASLQSNTAKAEIQKAYQRLKDVLANSQPGQQPQQRTR